MMSCQKLFNFASCARALTSNASRNTERVSFNSSRSKLYNRPSTVIVKDGAEEEPTAANDLEIGEVLLPELVWFDCLIPELIGRSGHHTRFNRSSFDSAPTISQNIFPWKRSSRGRFCDSAVSVNHVPAFEYDFEVSEFFTQSEGSRFLSSS